MMNRLRYVRLKDYRNVFTKHLSTEPTANRVQLVQLTNRSVIRLRGDSVTEFLQSLITNDINHLSQQPAIFTMLLNKAGRVLYDAIIYKSKENTQLLVECDAQSDVDLVKHLKVFRERKKIDIDVADDLTIWVAFDPDASKKDFIPTDRLIDFKTLFKSDDDLITCNDPRIQNLGVRIIATKASDVLQRLSPQNIYQCSPNYYQIHRYKLGVAEGIDELPYGKCSPLESNCDYLHCVSFHKGFYLGQEFMARDTGVIPKRLMPLQLVGKLTESCSSSKHYATTGGYAVGKLHGYQQDWGLGLLRVEVALRQTSPFILAGAEEYVKGTTYKPFWWPAEYPKVLRSMSKERRTNPFGGHPKLRN